MPENSLLLFAFLMQVLLISGFVPGRVLRALDAIVSNYPPHEYAKLYPVSIERVRRARNAYRNLNIAILIVGMLLVGSALVAPHAELLHWDTQSVSVLYFFIQNTPWFLIWKSPGFVFFNSRRQPNASGKRSAELKKRSLLDFVSPLSLWFAGSSYMLFMMVVLVAPERWGAGYWNLLYITLAQVYFGGFIFWALHGKRTDPYLADDDRAKQIGRTIRLLIYTSIAVTWFLLINNTLKPYGLDDVAACFYFIAIGMFTLYATRIDGVDFEVYRASGPPRTVPGNS